MPTLAVGMFYECVVRHSLTYGNRGECSCGRLILTPPPMGRVLVFRAVSFVGFFRSFTGNVEIVDRGYYTR